MRVVCLKQLGLLVVVAAGAGVGCGEREPTATSTVTSELHPMPKASPFEAKVRQSNLVADQDGFARKTIRICRTPGAWRSRDAPSGSPPTTRGRIASTAKTGSWAR